MKCTDLYAEFVLHLYQICVIFQTAMQQQQIKQKACVIVAIGDMGCRIEGVLNIRKINEKTHAQTVEYGARHAKNWDYVLNVMVFM